MKRMYKVASLAIWCPTHSLVTVEPVSKPKRLSRDNFGGLF